MLSDNKMQSLKDKLEAIKVIVNDEVLADETAVDEVAPPAVDVPVEVPVVDAEPTVETPVAEDAPVDITSETAE